MTEDASLGTVVAVRERQGCNGLVDEEELHR